MPVRLQVEIEKNWTVSSVRGNHWASESHVMTNVEERTDIFKETGQMFHLLASKRSLSRQLRLQCFGCHGRHYMAVWNGAWGVTVVILLRREHLICQKQLRLLAQECTFFYKLCKLSFRGQRRDLLAVCTFKLFLITGAQRSYITQKVVNVKTERLEIATFGDQKQGLEAVNLVELTFTKPAWGFETTLIAFLHICVDLQGEAWVKATYPSLRDIEVADACPDNSPTHVDLLIGSDYIWNFFDGQTIWGRSQVKVVHPTKGGWVLSGPVENLPREKLRSIQFCLTMCYK